jgi:DNA-binding MarR family transcriptional regulator
MKAPFEELAGLDRLVHEPARLAILTALGSCESANFLYLQRITGLSKGNLSSHLAKLEEGKLVSVTKAFKVKLPQTMVTLTAAGKKAIEAHWAELDRLRARAGRWQPSPDDDAT